MIERRPAGTNWSGSHRYRAPHVLVPSSAAELSDLVAASERLRVVGTRHTFNDLADTRGDLVSLERLPSVIDVDVDAGVVRVSGAVTFAALAPELEARGLALHNLGSLPHISVAGAVATGTHGSGSRRGNLSTAVRAIELVGPDGDTRRVDQTHPHFPALALGLGAFGVVTAVELQTEPSYRVTQEAYTGLTWPDLLADPGRLFASARSVSVFTTWQHEEIDLVWVKSTDADADAGYVSERGGRAVTGPLHLGRIRAVGNTTERHTPGPWHTRLPHFRADATPSDGDEIQSEYFVPLPRAAEALDAVRALASALDEILLVSELRTVAADALWLSPAFEREVLAIHFTWRNDSAGVAAVLPRIEAALAPFDVRPHWGKAFTMAGADIRATLPRAADFLPAVRAHDPRGTFWNAFLRRVFED